MSESRKRNEPGKGQRVRVLRIIARMNVGGPAQHVTVLGRGLDASRFETLLVTGEVGHGEESMMDLAAEAGISVRVVPALGPELSASRDQRALRDLVRLMRAFRPHIVHTHTSKAGVLGRLAALALQPRPLVLHTYHGHVLEGYFGPIQTSALRVAERLLGKASDALVTVSDRILHDLVRLRIAPRCKFHVVHLGLNLDSFLALPPTPALNRRQDLNVADDSVVLAFTGRLVPIKRVDRLLRAVAQAIELGASAELVIVGDGPERKKLQALARDLGIRKQVHFCGYRRDVPELVAAADIGVLASDSEGTPVSLIELAAAGRPLVATDVGGVSDVVAPDCGELVPADSENVFARAIVRFAKDPRLRLTAGAAARSHVRARFGADRMVLEVANLYERLLEERTRHEP